jgi:type IV pilus assembly protein PilA
MNISALKLKLKALRAHRSGFTLIELLVVIGILAILLAIVLVAINPGRQFEQANDTKRSSDINAILNAIHQYAADNQGNLPFTIAADTAVPLSAAGLTAAGANPTTFCNNLIPIYMAALPTDPTLNSDPIQPANCADDDWDTGYVASRSATNNRVTVSHTASGIEVIR